MQKALVVGIDYYQHATPLRGCVDDAYAVKNVLATHGDGSPNFDVRILTGTGPNDVVTRASLKDQIVELFAAKVEIALFYFAGHGHIEPAGGYLLASDSQRGDAGVPLHEISGLANTSPAQAKVIILDSCHAGFAGRRSLHTPIAELSEGLTILTASTEDQYAVESEEGGLFTRLLVDGLQGGAANLLGQITPGAAYAHIDQSLGEWGQRPVFKTNVQRFVSLRKVHPPIELADLRRITELFPTRGHHFHLDPTFEPNLRGREPGMPPPIPEHTRTFALLQKYNRVNLLVPVDAPHMWHAAMERKSCKLTVLGEHYRRLVEDKRI